MSAPLDNVMDILEVLKSQDSTFANLTIPVSFCRIGVTQASITLKKDFPMTYILNPDETKTYTINADITEKELYLAGLYAYRNYAVKQHDQLTGKALNFKTISFAVTGLTERAKEAMQIVKWADKEITSVLLNLGVPVGSASVMVGDTL